ncbi:uncharacterized protein PRCAT00000835001 [Priceomyces carsonii]|uniref:uncharacterized protein n=1 Tax=Priceomyces carsonii TaxID=28549 RepID=UPI002ED8C962|nr:unnamed protein product [Priceomyces carsonii]
MLQVVKRVYSKSSIGMLLSIYNYLFSRQPYNNTRSYSTNNPIISSKVADGFHPRLKTIFQQLDAIAPRFTLRKGDIKILMDPRDFYATLKLMIDLAKSRVFLSSLYIGRGQQDLVDHISKALETNEDLKVYILTDALRGTREAPESLCSASLLVPLVEKFGKHRIDVRMYHTPHLNGFKKSFTPKRVNESWGLQHMKLYGIDDEILMTGANLSEDYFTDRQDRYYILKSKALTDYYFDIQSAISSLSYQVLTSTKQEQGFRLSWPTSNKSCEPHINVQRFISDSSFLLEPLLKQHRLTSFDEFKDTDEFDTIVYPVSQFTPLLHPQNDTSTEKPAVLRVLSYLDSPKIKWWFTAGYFNMLAEIQERLINGAAKGVVITASAQANSFYKSRGVSYYIPEAYLLLAKKFLEEVSRRGKESLIRLYEWKKGVVNTVGGWSYHAKGIWITVPEEDEPSITVIGSSNYTKRSYLLDLESNAIIITKDENLKLDMKKEIEHLMIDVEELKLSDFEPKPLPQSESGEENGPHRNEGPKYAIDENRKISYGVHLAVKVIGDKL